MWAERLPDGRVRVGISAFGVHLSGDFFMCRPKPSGTALRQGDTLAVAELSKMVVAIKTPVSGVIDEVNALLEEHPEVIARAPYTDGWLVTLRATHWDTDLPQLAHGPGLAAAMEARMRLENLDASGALPPSSR